MNGKVSGHCFTSLNATKQGWGVAPYFAAPNRGRGGMQRVGIAVSFTSVCISLSRLYIRDPFLAYGRYKLHPHPTSFKSWHVY